jgi:hypothetical protein
MVVGIVLLVTVDTVTIVTVIIHLLQFRNSQHEHEIALIDFLPEVTAVFRWSLTS